MSSISSRAPRGAKRGVTPMVLLIRTSRMAGRPVRAGPAASAATEAASAPHVPPLRPVTLLRPPLAERAEQRADAKGGGRALLRRRVPQSCDRRRHGNSPGSLQGALPGLDPVSADAPQTADRGHLGL